MHLNTKYEASWDPREIETCIPIIVLPSSSVTTQPLTVSFVQDDP